MNELRILYIVLFFSALSWGQKEKVSVPFYVDIRYNNFKYILFFVPPHIRVES